jgi:hypothetical protein
MSECGILFPSWSNDHKDECGCALPIAHNGPHEFINTKGQKIQWETDWNCNCDTCQGDDMGDYCVVWWKSENQQSQQSEQVTNGTIKTQLTNRIAD